jgi:hypothetical protein
MSMIQRFLAWNAARPQRKAARAERRRLKDLGWNIRHRHQSLANYLNFNPKGTEEKFTFEARLKAEYGWDDEQVKSAIGEYAKFLAAAVCADGPLVPSLPVDMVWKQHILFGRHYVTGLCGKMLGRFIHRRASLDVVADKAELETAWKRTEEAYTAAFGEAPAGIWNERSTSFTKVVHFPGSSAARQFLRDRRADDETKTSSSGGIDPLSAYLFYVVLIQPHYNSDTHQHTTKSGSDAAAVVSDPELGTDGGTDSTFDSDSGTDSGGDTGSSCSSCSSCSS